MRLNSKSNAKLMRKDKNCWQRRSLSGLCLICTSTSNFSYLNVGIWSRASLRRALMQTFRVFRAVRVVGKNLNLFNRFFSFASLKIHWTFVGPTSPHVRAYTPALFLLLAYPSDWFYFKVLLLSDHAVIPFFKRAAFSLPCLPFIQMKLAPLWPGKSFAVNRKFGTVL